MVASTLELKREFINHYTFGMWCSSTSILVRLDAGYQCIPDIRFTLLFVEQRVLVEILYPVRESRDLIPDISVYLISGLLFYL